jgi:hypothetical protein
MIKGGDSGGYQSLGARMGPDYGDGGGSESNASLKMWGGGGVIFVVILFFHYK